METANRRRTRFDSISENELGFTTSSGTYVIDLDTEKIVSFQPLEGKKFIKSFNYNKENGILSYTQAEIEWWTHNIYLENPKKTLTIDSINLYKVRPLSMNNHKIKKVFIFICSFILDILGIFIFKDIFYAKKIIIKYAINPFDICEKQPQLWNNIKLLFVFSYIITHFL